MKKRVLAVILGAVMTMMMERRVTQSVFPSSQSMVLLIIAVRDF